MSSVPQSHLAFLTGKINDMLCDFDFDAIDRGLGAGISNITNDEEVHPVVIVAWLRTTFPVRTKLKNWIPYLTVARKYLTEKQFDVERILVGLNDDRQ
jgi:hypothetical protein